MGIFAERIIAFFYALAIILADFAGVNPPIEKVENAAQELGYVPQKRKPRKESKKEKLLVVFCSLQWYLANAGYWPVVHIHDTR